MSHDFAIKINFPEVAQFYTEATHLPMPSSNDSQEWEFYNKTKSLTRFKSPVHVFQEWLSNKGIFSDEYEAYLRDKDYIELYRSTKAWNKLNFGSEIFSLEIQNMFKQSPKILSDGSYKQGYVYLKKRE